MAITILDIPPHSILLLCEHMTILAWIAILLSYNVFK